MCLRSVPHPLLSPTVSLVLVALTIVLLKLSRRLHIALYTLRSAACEYLKANDPVSRFAGAGSFCGREELGTRVNFMMPNSEKLRRIQGILQGHVSSSTSSVWGAVTALKLVRATLKGCRR